MWNGVEAPKRKSSLGPSVGEVSLDGVEVTQVIQNMKHSVPLVANKPTVVRVYLSRPTGGAINVRGEISVKRSAGGAAKIIPSLDTAQIKPAQNGKLQVKREDLRLSLNFLIPAQETTAGKAIIRLASLKNVATAAPVVCTNCNKDVTVEFAETPSLIVRLVRLRYKFGAPPVNQVATARDLSLIKSWLRRAYPVAEVITSEVTVDAAISPPFDRDDGTNDCDDTNAQLSALRNLDMSGGGVDKRTHYYGLVSDASGNSFMRGCAHVPPTPNPTAVGSWPVGAYDYGWDKDGSYGDWYTGHELGHTFGRAHIGSGCGETDDDNQYPFPKGQLSDKNGEFVGFDIGDASLGVPMAVLPGAQWHDVMSYCPNQWISSYTYVGILRRLRAEAKLGAGPAHDAADAVEADAVDVADALEVKMDTGSFINVVATVNLTKRAGKIKYVTPVSGVVAPQADQKSRVTIRFKSADEEVLAEHRAAVKINSCLEPGKDEKGVVDAMIPRSAGASLVEMLIDGEMVDTYLAGSRPPQISNVRKRVVEADADATESTDIPNTTEELVSFEWDVGDGEADAAADADSSNVTYSVQVSTDGGATWQTIAVGRTTPDATIDRNQFHDAGDNIMVRVIATNGFDSSVATSEAIPVDTL